MLSEGVERVREIEEEGSKIRIWNIRLGKVRMKNRYRTKKSKTDRVDVKKEIKGWI